MTGTGATFVAEGRAYGVDPAFLVAIAGAETSFGELLYSENGDQCTYNAFNWFFGPTWPQSDFGSWDEAIGRVAQGLGELYYGAGLYSVDAIAPKYCPDGTEQWVTNVKAFLTELGGNPDDTRVTAAGVAPVPSPTPPSSEPGLVALSGSVKLDKGDREVGQRIYAWFTLSNTGGQPIDLEGIRLAIRGPGRVVRDLVSTSRSLSPPASPSRCLPRGRSTCPAAGTAGSRSRGTARRASSATSRPSHSGSSCPGAHAPPLGAARLGSNQAL